MAKNLSVSQVIKPQHLSSIVHRTITLSVGTQQQDEALMEVYTGWLLADHQAAQLLGSETIVSFLLVEPKLIHRYEEEQYLIASAVTASVSGAFINENSQDHVVAFDEAEVNLEPNSIVSNIAKNAQWYPILRVKVAALRGILQRVSYQVTLLSHDLNPKETKLHSGDTPSYFN